MNANFRFDFRAITISLFILGCAACSERQSVDSLVKPLAPSQVILEVGDDKISAQDVQEETQPEIAQLKEQMAKIYQHSAESLARKHLMIKAAKNAGFAQVDDWIQAEKAKLEPSMTELNDYMKRNKITVSGANEIKNFLKQQAWITREQEIIQQLKTKQIWKWKLEVPKHDFSFVNDDFRVGDANAKHQLHLFCDFKNPLCESMISSALSLTTRYANTLQSKFVFIFDNHNQESRLASQAAVCAGNKKSFTRFMTEISKVLVTHQTYSREQLRSWTGMNDQEFDACLNSTSTLLRDWQNNAKKEGIVRTPAIFLDGVRVSSFDEVSEHLAN